MAEPGIARSSGALGLYTSHRSVHYLFAMSAIVFVYTLQYKCLFTTYCNAYLSRIILSDGLTWKELYILLMVHALELFMQQ